ncbi:MAG: LapA family protein [Deltaproteobacteria bacterium]|nr:LapA family protein [Deltaproteobacteria bacterium]
MKTIKYLLWLIILILFGILIYQNLDYFMASRALKFDLKVASWNWTMPELQNIAYFGICFISGLILAGIKGFFTNFKLKKAIKTKDAANASLKKQVNTLKTELEVFQHDPYIRKKLEEKKSDKLSQSQKPETDREKDNNPNTTD